MSADTAADTPARTRLGIMFGAFVALGLSSSAVGAAWPEMRHAFGQEVSALGWIGVGTTVTYGVAAALMGRAARALGAGRMFALAGTIAGASTLAMSASRSWILLLVLASLVGVGTGLLDSGGNAYVASHHGVKAMGVLHASFGVGAVLSPLIIGLALRAGVSWRVAFVVTGALFMALVAAVAVQRAGWRIGGAVEGDAAYLPPAANPKVALGIVMFAAYVGFEIALPQWAASVLRDLRHASKSSSSLWVAGFWGPYTLVRVFLGWLTKRFGVHRVLDVSMGVALVGALTFWLVPTELGAGIGLLLAGSGQAAFFPMHITLTAHRVGSVRSTTVIGRQFTAASVGFLSASAAVGWIVHVFSLRALGPTVVVLGAVTVVLDRVVRAELRRQPS